MLTFVLGDITTMSTDAIVNAANERLSDGAGVNGAIHRAAGPGLPIACRAVAPCPTGQARITPGFDLPARFIIHTVGPIWHGGGHGEADLLRSAYRNSTALADEHDLHSVAFPAISCGIFGYPVEEAARIAVSTVRQAKVGTSVEQVTFVLFTADLLAAFESAG
ncbi:MAG: O-acetyl-ADP-ribose deacetylase [Candidatus Nanopelagicales bacterium]|jgi:O-acetyl-ADP-ribose deacetylase (regulator of RNase III)|nr:O-acetyl-ADP-ribose deacetylase [Candidatus Nanopelagicales bacterium]